MITFDFRAFGHRFLSRSPNLCTMNKLRLSGIIVLSLFLLGRPSSAQTFQNLDFEDSTVLARSFQPSGTYWTGLADLPHWAAYGYGVESNYTGGTCLDFNIRTLDSPGVFLEGTEYPAPAIAGDYSVLLLTGSTICYGGHDRASIWQTGLSRRLSRRGQNSIYEYMTSELAFVSRSGVGQP